MPSALQFQSVGFAYGRTPIFESLDLSLAGGEMTAVLGPNGTGKTTLVRLASGHLAPTSGDVFLFGRSLGAIGVKERARTVAVVPQETQMVFDFTAREVVLMGRAPHLGLLGFETGGDLLAVQEAMRLTDVAGFADRPFNQLSGGEKQRVVLARSLAQNPRLLLLDEPTAFLDLKHRLVLYDLLARLNRETGLTILVASHDIDLASRFCSRLILLHRGRIAADGSAESVLRPENLRQVYEVDAEVRLDPATRRPYVVPLRPSD